MPIQVRTATPADAPVVIEFNRSLARETEHKELDPAIVGPGVERALVDETKGRYFLAERDGRVVGQLAITLEWSDWRNGWFWWIQSVYVRAEARRSGVFRALYEHVRQAALRDPDVIGIRLYVEADNRAAQATYRSLGFARTSYLVMEKHPK